MFGFLTVVLAMHITSQRDLFLSLGSAPHGSIVTCAKLLISSERSWKDCAYYVATNGGGNHALRCFICTRQVALRRTCCQSLLLGQS